MTILFLPGNRNKGKGNGAGLAKKASRTALQTSSVNEPHLLKGTVPDYSTNLVS